MTTKLKTRLSDRRAKSSELQKFRRYTQTWESTEPENSSEKRQEKDLLHKVMTNLEYLVTCPDNAKKIQLDDPRMTTAPVAENLGLQLRTLFKKIDYSVPKLVEDDKPVASIILEMIQYAWEHMFWNQNLLVNSFLGYNEQTLRQLVGHMIRQSSQDLSLDGFLQSLDIKTFLLENPGLDHVRFLLTALNEHAWEIIEKHYIQDYLRMFLPVHGVDAREASSRSYSVLTRLKPTDSMNAARISGRTQARYSRGEGRQRVGPSKSLGTKSQSTVTGTVPQIPRVVVNPSETIQPTNPTNLISTRDLLAILGYHISRSDFDPYTLVQDFEEPAVAGNRNLAHQIFFQIARYHTINHYKRLHPKFKFKPAFENQIRNFEKLLEIYHIWIRFYRTIFRPDILLARAGTYNKSPALFEKMFLYQKMRFKNDFTENWINIHDHVVSLRTSSASELGSWKDSVTKEYDKLQARKSEFDELQGVCFSQHQQIKSSQNYFHVIFSIEIQKLFDDSKHQMADLTSEPSL